MTRTEINNDKRERYYALNRRIVVLCDQNLQSYSAVRSAQINSLADAAKCLKKGLIKAGLLG